MIYWAGNQVQGLWFPAFAGMAAGAPVATPSQPRQPPRYVIAVCRHATSSRCVGTLRHPRMSLAGNQVQGFWFPAFAGMTAGAPVATPSPPRQPPRYVIAVCRHATSSRMSPHHVIPHVVGGEPGAGSLVSRLRGNDGRRAGRHTESATPSQPRRPPRYVIAVCRHTTSSRMSPHYVIPACRWRGTRCRVSGFPPSRE
jgi:hypothetical protein